jgi:hypothetical protein
MASGGGDFDDQPLPLRGELFILSEMRFSSSQYGIGSLFLELLAIRCQKVLYIAIKQKRETKGSREF